jgi:hypothetical protein
LQALTTAFGSFTPYSPDRNPDELVWKHLKADTVGRASITSLDDFKEKVKSLLTYALVNSEGMGVKPSRFTEGQVFSRHLTNGRASMVTSRYLTPTP